MIGVVIVSYRSDDLTVRFVRKDRVRITLPYKGVVVDNNIVFTGEISKGTM